ncbi:ribosome recycling factor [Thermopetrobacter sp. TC1]|uniref:ribosome recycling factor n=1 Tax=Thermopetrobacter sp. TC1 TaxID=1495045 RepID=UPI000571ACF7|nr:ribosome recycling factor [Thermopetrobacter sp. TC1]
MSDADSLDLKDLKRRMEGAVNVLKEEFAGLRTGRASAALLEHIQVNAYGSKMPINQLGTISVPEPRLLSVQVWDASVVSAVEKAIREANLGLNPQTEGNVIRVPIPELSKERRKELSRVAHQYAEQARVAVRNVRRDGMETLKRLEKEHQISEDEHRRLADEVQELTNTYIKKIDEMLAAKDAEIMQV